MNSTRAEPNTAHLELEADWLRVHFGAGGGHADFHFRWLRHNCDVDRHPTTGERIVCSSELPERLLVRSARVHDGALFVLWEHDGRESRYALRWLAENAYAKDRAAVPPPPCDLSLIEVHAPGPITAALADEAVSRALRRGAVVVRRASPPADPAGETETIIDAFAAGGLSVIGTHFGRIEDLRTDNTTNQNTDQLGYTDAPVELHTDQPFIEKPPRFQLLQSIRSADSGGDNYVVDGLLAAKYLDSIDAPAAKLLRETPVRFHRKQKAFESVELQPILRFGEGASFQIRYSYFTMAPHQLPFAEMEAFYRAYDTFARLVREAKHQYRFALRPGDFLLYDNHRMLHARTSFRGARWVRGVYFDRSDG